jgi:hypothetical protein
VIDAGGKTVNEALEAVACHSDGEVAAVLLVWRVLGRRERERRREC